MASPEKRKPPKSPPIRFHKPKGPPAFRESTKENQMRFRAGKGAEIGSCPRCYKLGYIGDYCIPCYEATGWDLGECDRCTSYGPVGEECLECEGIYEEIITYGLCEGCSRVGIGGSDCTSCVGQGRIFE